MCQKLISVLCLSMLVLANVAAAQERTLKFPSDRSLGMVKLLPDPEDKLSWWWGNPPEETVAEAKGDVRVPADKHVGLVVSREGWADLSPLVDLKPGAIEVLWLPCGTSKDKPGDGCLVPISEMAGLKTLCLYEAGVTGAGLSLLTNMASLERLSVWENDLDESAFAQLAQIRSLRGLRFYTGSLVSAETLSQLASLPLLEDLFLPQLQREAYSCLKQLASLQALFLGGVGHGAELIAQLAHLTSLQHLSMGDLTDEELAALPDMPSLKRLEIDGEGYEYTAAGFANLSHFTGLESLHVVGALSDAAVAAIEPLPNLKELRFQAGMNDSRDFISDAALAHLADFPSLEFLWLYFGRFNEEGLQHLSKLPNLKLLCMPNNMGLTDAGMEQLAKLCRLEQLKIRASNITDAGLMQLESLISLRELRLFCRHQSQITDEAIAHLQEKIPGLVIEE